MSKRAGQFEGRVGGSARCVVPVEARFGSGWSRRIPVCALWPVVVLGALLMAFGSVAQYAIDWFTIDGGGGTSTGGVFTVNGTIGQPDAGAVMTNGQYAVTGGLWALPQAVQTPGVPLLSILATAPGFATISWTQGLAGYVLQETMSLAPTNWVDSASGTNNPADVALTNTARFYRLRKP